MSEYFSTKFDEFKRQARTYNKVLCIDSRSRRTNDADNSYQVEFERISNVTKIELLSAEVSNRLYAIDATNNAIDFTYNAGLQAVTVAAGTYNGTELAAAMQAAMVAASGAGTVTVTFNEVTNKMTFASFTQTTVLHAGTGANIATGIWEAIGFDATDITILAAAAFTGQNTVQLKEGEHYIFLCLDGYGSMESSDNISNIFAKLVTDDLNKFKEFYSIAKTYSASSPLPSLQSLNVSFRRRDGSLYKMRNEPSSFSLLVSYVQ